MSQLWVPDHIKPRRDPKVSKQHAEGTRAWEQQVLSCMHMTGPVQDHWNPELQKIDPNMRLAQAYDRAECVGVMPGFWHFMRLRNPARHEMLMIVPLRNPVDNGFIEPSSAMLEALRMCDLQNDRAVEARIINDRRAAASAERAKENEVEERRDEGRERYLAASRTQILTSTDVPWSQNNSPAARRDRGERSKG